MKVPKYIKNLINKREDLTTRYIVCESKLNDWLEREEIFDVVVCGEYSNLFNTGCAAMESGSAKVAIEYLESL